MKTVNVINDLQDDYQNAFKAWANMNTGQEFNYAKVEVIEKVIQGDQTSFVVSALIRTNVLNQ